MNERNSCIVQTKTTSTYTLKNGSTCIITRKYNDYIHTVKGITTKRELLSIDVSGSADKEMLKEVHEWVLNRCDPPIPTLIKQYMKEQQ